MSCVCYKQYGSAYSLCEMNNALAPKTIVCNIKLDYNLIKCFMSLANILLGKNKLCLVLSIISIKRVVNKMGLDS